MFEQHFGLRENPFHSGHQLRFLYPSREHQEARAHLRYGIENREPFVLITGEVGTGKTTALYDALAEWGSKVAVALITNSALSRQELIEEIGLRFGLSVPHGTSKPQALALLERHLTGVRARGEHAVLLLDEAQNLAPELLEEIRLLSNLEVQGDKLVQIFLVGQPELEALLSDPQLRQLRQRISVHYRLNPLSHEETTAYIHHRIAVAGGNPWTTFPAESCREVYRLTHGIPREINTVASQALIAAFSEGATTVAPGHVKAVTHENEFRSVMKGLADVPEAGDEPMPGLAAPAVPAASRASEPPAPEPAPASPALPIEFAGLGGDIVQADPARVPAWTPPELGDALPVPPPPPLAVPPAREPEEAAQAVDAWTSAAQELMEARRRGKAAEAPPRVEVIASPDVVAGAHSGEPLSAEEYAAHARRFPSREELEAHAVDAQPDNADLSGLPERLREKIAADIAEEEARESTKRRAVPALLAGVIVLALVAGTYVLEKMQVIDLPFLRGIAGASADTTAHAAREPAPLAVTTPVTHARADSARHDSLVATRDTAEAGTPPATRSHAPAPRPATTAPLAAATVKPGAPTNSAAPKGSATTTAATTSSGHLATASHVPTPTVRTSAATSTPRPATGAARAPAPAPAPASGPATPAAGTSATSATAARPTAGGTVYGLGVAAYLDRDRAEQERVRLASASGLPSVVIPFDDGGTTRFRVVLGHYPSNAAAENAALALMEKLGVSEARPLVLSRGGAH